jgi:hypothetical protein
MDKKKEKKRGRSEGDGEGQRGINQSIFGTQMS